MSNVEAVSYPRPTGASKAAISAFAEKLAAHVNFNPGDLIKSFVTRLGGRIEYRNPDISDPSRLPESIIVYSLTNFVIYVPNITSPERDRFTIAHELGHYYLHYPLTQQDQPGVPMVATRWVDQTNAEQQRAEWEANWFAAAFLMPSALFRQAYIQSGKSVQSVASQFGVSRKAAEVRVSTLSL